MASAYKYFDKRSPKEDCTCPILIRIYHLGDTMPIKTGISCTTSQWDKSNLSILNLKKDPFKNYAKANKDIRDLLDKAIDYIDKNKHRLHLLTCKQLRDEIEQYDPEAAKKKEEKEEAKKSITLEDAIDQYLKYMRNEDPDVPEHEKRQRDSDYIKTVGKMLGVLRDSIGGKKPIHLIDKMDAGLFYSAVETRELAGTTFNNYISCGSVFFKYLIKSGYSCTNTIEDIPRKKPVLDPKMLDIQEFHQVLKKVDKGNPIQVYKYKGKKGAKMGMDLIEQKNMYRPWLKNAYRIALYWGGRRRGEIALLKWNEIFVHPNASTPLHGEIIYTDFKSNGITNARHKDEQKKITVIINQEIARILIDMGWQEKRDLNEYIIGPEFSNRSTVKKFLTRSFAHYYKQIDEPRDKISFKSIRKTYSTYTKKLMGNLTHKITGHATEEVVDTNYVDLKLMRQHVADNLKFDEKK